MALGTFGSRILGLLRDILMAATFSAVITDAWLVAYRIPNLFRRLFGEGALSVSFIPLLIESRKRKGEEEESKLVNGVFSLLFLLLGSFSLLCIFFSTEIVGIVAGGEAFQSIAGKAAFTAKFLQIMAFFMLFICMFAFFMALLNSRKRFFAAAFAPILLNICLITACLLPGQWLPVPGEWLAWMALLGGFLQMAVLIPGVIKQGLIPKFQFDFLNKEVLQVMKNSAPAFLTMGILQITTLVNVYYASKLENGSNTWIYLADRLLELPLSLIAVSFATALLPSLAEKWADDDQRAFGRIFQSQLQFTLFLAIPAGIGLYMLAEPLVQLMFERGKFNVSHTIKTASVLKVYAFSLIIYASIRIVNVCFYATKKVWLPALGSSLGLVSHLLMVGFWMEQYGLPGLALSTALSGAFNLILQGVVYKKTFQVFALSRFVKNSMKYLLAGAAMAVFLPLYYRVIQEGQLVGAFKVAFLLGVIVVAAIIYFFVSYLLKVEELDRLRSRFSRNKGA